MKGICKVILRVISVCVMLKSFSFIQGYILFLLSPGLKDSPNDILTTVYFVVTFLSYVLLGVIIWVFSDRISSLMIKDDDIQTSLSTDILLRTAIIVAGVIFMANTLPSLVGNVYEFITVQNFIKNNTSMAGYNGFLEVKSAIITDLLKIGVSIFMITGYRIIIKISTYLGNKKEYLNESNGDSDD